MSDKSTQTFKLTTLLMLGVFLLYGMFEIIRGEVMSFENGFAWDAATYRNVTIDFPDQVFNHNLNVYSIQRILPPSLIYFTFKIFNVSFSDSNIITAFRILNLVSILVSILFFNLISNELQFKKEIRWLGFFGIFINYAFIRQSFYYPVHTDTAAFALGMALLYFYIKKSYPAMFIITFAGMFTWPSFIFTALPLFAFPYENNINNHHGERRKSMFVTISLVMIIAVMIIYVYYINKYYTKISRGVAYPDNSVIILSIFALIAYIYFAFNKIIDYKKLYDFRTILKKIQYKYFLLWGLLFICLIVFGKIFADKSASPETAKSLVGGFLIVAITEPLISVISHVIYFGPLLIITVFLWNKYCREIHSHGLGLTLLVVAALSFSIGSESRRFINLMPVIFIFTGKVLNEFHFRGWQVMFFGFVSLVFSKIWFRMNTDLFPSDMSAFQDFPWQNYFMNIGPWMSHQLYFVQGSIVIITGVLLYFVYIRNYKVIGS